ncbi:MAG: endopeptidase La [Eubacteriales bacterium]|nr:endopeptidase La [Eubacteriales bacterium]MDD3290279.1 endopeptidase La [Eubacteriales bacterium]MDD4445538.1 endopeptidase La [Eubacteriales bacterium]
MGEPIKSSEQIGQEQKTTEVMPLIPLRGLTVFPNMVLHFDIGREKSILALERAMMLNQSIFLTTQKDAETDLPTADDFYHMGTVARIKQMLKLPGDNIRVLVDGQYRAKMLAVVQETPYFLCDTEKIQEEGAGPKTPDIIALMRTVINLFSEYLNRHPRMSLDVISGVEALEDPGRLADIIASNMELKTEESQKVLEAIDPAVRLRLVMEYLTREIEILRLEDKISSKVKTQMSKSQREYYLREQLRAIQEELGQDESVDSEIQSWMKQLKKLKLSPVVTQKVEKEIGRLSKMAPNMPEASVIRSYVEWILDLPWNKASKSDIDLLEANRILEQDHYGLEKVKERILEYLAVLSLVKSQKGPILCLVGPPGVGKTSIARSIARAMGRKFAHMSLGGVRDEAEIRGHRRTYIGAIPGRVMSAVKECGTNNPVFLFDEVDKIGADFRGDPASALLEVLDPEQNKEFVDHYLEIPFDLSGVMFITTANTVDTIPRPLLDRMEVIRISGYTEEEKVQIAKKYLIPKQLKAHGLTRKNIALADSAIHGLINNYTRESGVRNLEKEIANLCRKVARKVVEGNQEKSSITAKTLETYLGKKRFRYDRMQGSNEVGVTTGLAWTVVGGDTLFIETAVLPGTGQLSLTGQLGDVMQESAKAAISYIRAKSGHLKLDKNFYKEKDIHIHIPEGATPKDGPSAGVTMCLSVISALTGRPVRKEVAMTGEITLRGKILPVGGIKEKMLAAHRAGIKKVLIPADNAQDLEELPAIVKEEVEFVLIKKVDDAIKEALL